MLQHRREDRATSESARSKSVRQRAGASIADDAGRVEAKWNAELTEGAPHADGHGDPLIERRRLRAQNQQGVIERLRARVDGNI